MLLTIIPIFKDELCFTFARSHPWSSLRTLPRDQIPRQPYILYPQSSMTGQLIEKYFAAEQMVLFTVMEIDTTEVIKELVRLNLGISILVPWIAERELKQGSLRMRPLEHRPLHRQWAILHTAGRRMNLIEETFCQLCRKQVAELWTRPGRPISR